MRTAPDRPVRTSVRGLQGGRGRHQPGTCRGRDGGGAPEGNVRLRRMPRPQAKAKGIGVWRGPFIAARRLSRDARRPSARTVSAGDMTLPPVRQRARRRDYFPLLRWMIFTGVTLFGFAIAWRYGLFQLMMAQDRSGISVFICILYVAISGHCLACVLAISREINTAHRVRERVLNGVNAYRTRGTGGSFTDDGNRLPAGRVTDYIRNLVVKAEKQGRGAAARPDLAAARPGRQVQVADAVWRLRRRRAVKARLARHDRRVHPDAVPDRHARKFRPDIDEVVDEGHERRYGGGDVHDARRVLSDRSW